MVVPVLLISSLLWLARWWRPALIYFINLLPLCGEGFSCKTVHWGIHGASLPLGKYSKHIIMKPWRRVRVDSVSSHCCKNTPSLVGRICRWRIHRLREPTASGVSTQGWNALWIQRDDSTLPFLAIGIPLFCIRLWLWHLEIMWFRTNYLTSLYLFPHLCCCCC